VEAASFGEAVRYPNKLNKLGLFSSKGFPDNITFVVVLFVFIYTGIRAYCLSITHDEAITFLNHARGSFLDILTYTGPIRSNNHLLNTLLIKIFTNLFGISEFVIRIPTLIGLGFYLLGVYVILNLFLKRYSLLLGVCLLTWHPLMIDLFSCARGYSLGLGFMTLGLYYFFRRISHPEIGYDRKNYLLASTMFALSSLSHLSFLNVYVSMVGVYVLFELTILAKRRIPFDRPALHDAGRNIFYGIVPSSLFLLIVYSYPVIKMMKAGNEFSYGGENGFWQDTVGSLVEVTLQTPVLNPYIMLFSKVLIVALLLFALLTLLHDKAKNKDLNIVSKYLSCVTLLLIICSLSVIVQHFLLKIKYPIDRYAIYLIPIFFLVVLFCWGNIRFIENKLIRVIANSIFYLIIISLLVSFIICANITHFSQWKFDASTKDMLEDLIRMNGKLNLKDDSVQLGINWIFEPSTNYYILKNKIRWMKKVNRDGPEGMFDYYYVTPDCKDDLGKYDARIIRKYEVSGNYLAVSNKYLGGALREAEDCIGSVLQGRWKGEYYKNKDLSGNPVIVRDDGNGFIHFNWDEENLNLKCGVTPDNFSVRWTRELQFDRCTYRFTVTIDDGFKLFVDNEMKLEKWFDQPATTYTVDVPLSAGNHTVKMDYYQAGGQARASLSWEKK
jgi:hypothetical protein